MATVASDAKLTYQEYLAIPEDGQRHEILDGEHVMTPSPVTRHQTACGNIFALIWTFLHQNPRGRVFAAPLDVVLSEVDVVQPDLVFVSAARLDVITEINLSGAPDLVVEVLSENTRRRDEVVKRRLYARFAIPEYWLVDAELETVRVLRLAEGSYREAAFLSRETDDVLTTELLAGLRIPLVEIFR